MYTQNPMTANTYPYVQPQGYAYGPRPQPRCTQPVTAEMSRMLHQNDDILSVKISKTESIKNQCTHKEPGTGRLSLIQNADGSYTCRTCGETFNLITDPKDEIDKAVKTLIDTMQTIKTMYLDIPEDFTKEFFQSISLIKNLKPLYDRASKNFSMYEGYAGMGYPTSPNINSFQAVGNLMAVNPMMGVYPQQPVMYPQQSMAPQQVAPMGYPAPQPGMAPGWTQVGYDPNAAAAQYGQQAVPPMQANPANPMAYGMPTAPQPVPPVTGPAPVQAPAQQTAQQVPQNTEVQQTKTFTV